MISAKKILVTGSILGGLSVMIGAFGAHALKPLLTEYQRTETFELAVRYQFYHALAILFLGLVASKINVKQATWAFLFFVGGIILFSGSLYGYSLTNQTTFALITPVGGLFFLGGWIVLTIALLQSKLLQ